MSVMEPKCERDTDDIAVIDTGEGFDFYMPDEFANENGHPDGQPRKKRRTYIPRHECHICHKKFVRPAELQRHVRIHTGKAIK